MKIPCFKPVCAALAAAAALFSSACAPEEKTDPAQLQFDAYAQRVPENAVVFLGTYCPTEHQKKIFADAGWRKFVSALRGNAALAAKAKALLAEAEKESPELPLRKLVGDDPIAALAAFCETDEAPYAAVFFIDEAIDCSFGGKSPAWTFAATVAPNVSEKLSALLDELVACGNAQQSVTLSKEISEDGARAIFTLRDVSGDGNVVFCASFGGGEILAASSRERLDAFAESLAAPAPARGVFDAPLFAELAAGAPADSQIFAYLNFDGLKGFRARSRGNAWGKELAENARGIAFFGNAYSSMTSSTGVLRAAFAQPTRLHAMLGAMAARKIDVLGNALPNAAVALGLGVPALTPEIVELLEIPSSPEKSVADDLRKLDLQSFCLSFSEIEKVGSLMRRNFLDTPQFFAKIACGDVRVALEDPNVAGLLGGNPMIGKTKVGDDEVYGTAMFGIRFAPLGETAFYASNLPDAVAALNLAKGKGESLAGAGTFASVAEKIRGNNAFEIYTDDVAVQRMQAAIARASREEAEESFKEAGLEPPADGAEEISEFVTNCLNALTKKSLNAAALRLDGSSIELRCASEFELDFAALADEIEKIR